MILVLSRSLPPSISGSAIIVGNLARQFNRSEMIVLGEYRWRQPRVDWKAEYPRRVFVSCALPPFLRGERYWSYLQMPIMLALTLLCALKYKCSVIVAVFPSTEYVMVGYAVSVITGIPLVPYLHNTIAENHDRGRWLNRVNRKLQERVFSRASRVLVISEGLRRHYGSTRPGLKCSVLPHSIPEDLPLKAPPDRMGHPVRIAFAGNVNSSCLDACKRFVKVVGLMPDTRLTFLTATERDYLRYNGLMGENITIAAVTRDQLLARLMEFDILFLPHGLRGALSGVEYDTIFPTKTVEYLISGRPILAHAPATAYITEFLRQHRCALLVTEPDEAALRDAVLKIRSSPSLRQEIVRNAMLAATQFRGPDVANQLRDVLGHVTTASVHA